MGRKTSYDPEPLNRLRDGPSSNAAEENVSHAMDQVKEVLARAGDLHAQKHGIDPVAVDLWLADKLRKAADDLRRERVREALQAGISKASIALILDWRGGSSAVSRRMPDLDDEASTEA